jgi:hypothetical protein
LDVAGSGARERKKSAARAKRCHKSCDSDAAHRSADARRCGRAHQIRVVAPVALSKERRGRARRTPRARMAPRLAAAFILATTARAMSATKKRKQVQKLKELRASEWAHRRADKSAKKTMYYGIPDEWSRRGHIACSQDIDRGGDFVVAVASDAPDAVPIFAAINSTAANTRRRRLDVVAFVGAAATSSGWWRRIYGARGRSSTSA